MAAKQLMLPANRAFNSDGAPEVGATANLYVTNTLTPALFYSDSGLSISLGSTITANAAGRFPTAYQNESTPFRLIIKDSEGATLDDIDPYYFGTTNISFPAADFAFLTREAMAAVVPTNGSSAKLSEAGREGMFVYSTANHSANVTRDPAQGVYVPPTSAPTGASGAWVRKYDGHLNAAWFGATPGADIAPVMRNIITFAGDTAVSVFLPPSETAYLWNSKVDWSACVHLFSLNGSAAILAGVMAGFLHGAMIRVASGVTAIVPQRTASTYADFSTFTGITFQAVGKNTTSTTGSITQDARALTLAAAQDFANGQIVRVRGAGPSGYLQGNGLRGATTNGSAVITCTGLSGNIGAVPGQVLNVGSAFPAQTYVLSVDNVARTITMSANATSTVAATRITIYGDLYGYVISGGGTTTLNLNGMAHRTVTGAKVEHFDSAIFGFNSYVIEGCTFEDFQGCAAGMAAGSRYLGLDGVTATNANTVHWNGVNVRECTNGVVIDGTDVNANHFDNINCLSTTEWAIVEQSFLGNLWTNTHASGGYGILHIIEPASQSQFDWAYTEGGTVNSFGNSACGNGYQSGDEDGGLRFIPVNGLLGIPPLQVFSTYYDDTYGNWYIGQRRTDLNAAGVLSANLSAIGGSTSFQAFDTFRTGIVGITDGQANVTNVAFTMANHARGAGFTLVNKLMIGNGDQHASTINIDWFRNLGISSSAPASGIHEIGDVYLNSLPTAGSTLGWRCITAGTPGTWESLSFVRTDGGTMTGALVVPTEVYGAPWNGSNQVPTKDAVYDKVESLKAAAVANLTTTATTGTLPTPDGTVTIANAASPTVTELLEYCVELEAKLETLMANMRTAGTLTP